jgi:ABC-type uncharacterized transport system substrate-binding protein
MGKDGGLLSYGIDTLDNWRRAVAYADRILRGAKPSDLPVQLPTKFEMVLNLKTAKTLGLIPFPNRVESEKAPHSIHKGVAGHSPLNVIR